MGSEYEQQIKGQCGFLTGWWDADDAYAKAKRHARRCDTCEFNQIVYREREKEGRNYSDSNIQSGPTCPYCGSGNVPGATECGGCGGDILHAIL